jgi:hypothetical protein
MREVFSRAELLEFLLRLELEAEKRERSARKTYGHRNPEEERVALAHGEGLLAACEMLSEMMNKPIWLPSSNQA